MGVQSNPDVVFCTDTSLVDKPGFYAVDKHGQINTKKFVAPDAEGDKMINLAVQMKASSKAAFQGEK